MEEKEFNVLSLFDGISCGQLALNRAGIKYNKYYASEIDHRAIKVTQRNYPKTIQYGSVTKIKKEHFMSPIHLLMGGSPCQGFSFAGKQLNFDDPRSKLFFEFVRLKKELNPKYFFLENVRMDKNSEQTISNILGVEPIHFNSSLVSAQNRRRLYWTNISGFKVPTDNGILLKDIIKTELNTFGLAIRGRYNSTGKIEQVYELNNVEKANSLTTVLKDSMACIQIGKAIDIKGKDQIKRIYSTNGKSPTLTAVCGGHQEAKVAIDEFSYRKLSPIEYERLQGIPDNYTQCISQSARYHSIGNGWQVDSIVEFFKNIII